MRKGFQALLAAALLVYGLFILNKYGLSYGDVTGLAEFSGFAFHAILIRLLFPVALMLAAYGAGGAAFGRLMPEFGSLTEEFMFTSAPGLIVISYAMFALGLAGLLYPAAGFAVMGLALASGWRSIPRFLSRVSEVPRTVDIGLVHIVLVPLCAYFAVLGFYYALFPPTSFDVLMYHFGAPKMYIDAHRIFPTPDVNGSTYPFGIEMLYMLAMLVKGPITAKKISFYFVLLGGVAAAAFTRRFLPEASGLMSFAVYISIPMVYWLSAEPYIELGMAYYTMTGLYALFVWFEDGDRRWLYLAAVCIGYTLAVKYTGIILVAIACVFVLAHQAFQAKAGARKSLVTAATFVAFCVAVSAPWYLKNIIFYHNPVSPFLAGLFKEGAPEAHGVPVRFFAGGVADSAWKLVSSLWEVAFVSPKFQAKWSASAGPALLMLVPGVLIFYKDVKRELWYLLLFSLLFFWVTITQMNLRYIVPVFPALAVVAAYAPGRLVKGDTLPMRAAGLAALFLFAFGALMAVTPKTVPESFPSSDEATVDKYYMDKQKKSGYLASYEVWKRADSNLPKDVVIFQLWDDASVFFRTRNTVGNAKSWGQHGRQNVHRIKDVNGFGGFLPGEQIIYNLETMGAGYLLINSNREGRKVPSDPVFIEHTELVVRSNGVYLYKLK